MHEAPAGTLTRIDSQSPSLRLRPFVLASAASAVLILWAPFVGQVRRSLQRAFPGQFAAIVAAIVAVLVGFALVSAAARIRERRALRYGALLAALILAVGYSAATRTGRPEVDAVEHFHFVEYGLVTWLFYRAWRPLDDASIYVLPVLAALLVGIVDEWFQWLIPARIGELRDVFLNGAAIASGLLFSLGAAPPRRFLLRVGQSSRRQVGIMAAAFIVALAAFVHIVHLGYEIRDHEIGSFRSRYSREQLAALAVDRAAAWKEQTIPIPPRLSIEDQYFSEALWHVQRRNERWTEGNVPAAWRENLILETYFAPALDTPSYVSPTGHRWPTEQRADAQARAAADTGVYVSDAQPYPIYVWPRWVFWTVVATSLALVLLAI